MDIAEVNSLYHGELSLYDGALRRIVVNEHEAVKTETELISGFCDIPVLGLPVRLYGYKVGGGENTAGVLKTEESVFLLIFGADCKKYTVVLITLYEALEFLVCLSNGCLWTYLDALLTVIAYDAAPEGVIKVEFDDLVVLAVNGLDYAGKAVRKVGDNSCAHGILVEIPCLCVMPVGEAADS